MAEPKAFFSAAPIRRILVRSVNWLGDAVMTTPALRRLREKFPEARLTLLTRERLADLWLEQAVVDEVWRIGPDDTLWSVGSRLRAQAFDLALILPNSARSALEAWWGRVPTRVGFGGGWRRMLLTHAVPRPAGRVNMRKRSTTEVHRRLRAAKLRQTWPPAAHQLLDYLVLTQALGAVAEPCPPMLSVSRQALEGAVEKFALNGPVPGARPLFGINPGAEYGPAKRWPAERFAATAAEVHRRANCVWIITGGGADASVASLIERQLKENGADVVNTAGKTSLRELCALLSLCRVVLTNDTGPMHVAAAVGTPVVVPFGSTSPELTGPGLPGGNEHRFLSAPGVGCAPCFRRTCPVGFECMKEISVAAVTQAVMESARARESLKS